MTIAIRNILFLSFFVCLSCLLDAQTNWVDSVKKVALIQREDTSKVWSLAGISSYYGFNNPDSGIIYANQALALAEKLQFTKGIFWSLVAMDHSLFISGNYTLELDNALTARPLAEKLNDNYALGWSNGMLCDSYMNLGDYDTAMAYVRIIIKNIERYYPSELYSGYAIIVPVYIALQKYDSALICATKSYELLKANKTLFNGNTLESNYAKNQVYLYLGQAYEATQKYDSALFYYRLSVSLSKALHTNIFIIDAYNGIINIYRQQHNPDSAIWYAKVILDDPLAKSYVTGRLKATNLLANIYEDEKNNDSSLKYMHQAVNLKDSLFNREKLTLFQKSLSREQEKRKEIMAVQLTLRRQYRNYFILVAFAVITIITGIILKNKRLRQLQGIRNRIADDLHDDIGSTLSSISIMNELAKEKSPDALPLLMSIGESTSTIQENMSDIVWTLKTGNDRLENVLARMNQFAGEILEAKNIGVVFTSEVSAKSATLSMDRRKNFYLFFKEVINNAAKYSAAKKVSISVVQKNHFIEMNIHDDGKGFDTTKSYVGNGINSLKRRAGELNAFFEMISSPNEGTTVQLKFKNL